MNDYKNKVAWCPICDQGWVEIVQDVVTSDLFVYCNECESEQNQPSEVNFLNDRTEINDNRITTPADEVIRSVDWEKYIIKNQNLLYTTITLHQLNKNS